MTAAAALAQETNHADQPTPVTPLRVDILAKRYGGPDGGPDGMAVASAYLAFTLAESGHAVRCFVGEAGPPGWTHPRVTWHKVSPLFAPPDWTADIVISTIAPAWRRTALTAEAAGERGRVVYWLHHGTPPREPKGFVLAAPPAIQPTDGWARHVVLPPSSWAAEAGGERTGKAVLVPGAGAVKGGRIAYEVAKRCRDLPFFVLPMRCSSTELDPWRRLPNVTIAPGLLKPADFLARAGAVLSPTRAEVHPLTLVEAAVRGIPIACTDLPSTRAAAPQAQFVPVAARDAEAWEAALRAALASPPAPLRLRPYREVVAEALAWVRPGGRAAPAAAATVPVPRAPTVSTRAIRAAAPAARAAPVSRSAWRPPAPADKPRVLVLADTKGWAWERKARALQAQLSGRFHVDVALTEDTKTDGLIRAMRHDLYHTFEVLQVRHIPEGFQLTTGMTAHVARNWDEKRGAGTVKGWADRAIIFHANSRMLQREMEAYLKREIFYVPNGVDETFFRRIRPRRAKQLVVAHVARPNARKGADLVAEACRRAGVELRTNYRSSKNALPPEAMREFYQDVHVLVVSSDMDGTPNPALEAAACECAVVSNPIGNMPEFIHHGVNGMMTERTTDSLASALDELKRRPLDEVEEMGRAARRTILADWTWAKRATNYAEMWNQCLSRTK